MIRKACFTCGDEKSLACSVQQNEGCGRIRLLSVKMSREDVLVKGGAGKETGCCYHSKITLAQKQMCIN